MNWKVLTVLVVWVALCFCLHYTFGGFSGPSGFVEGCIGFVLASLFLEGK